MIDAELFLSYLEEAGIDFFTGVPDSLLKEFCFYLTDHICDDKHKICANEGNAVAMAAGHYLATGNPALVYMQNSGLGNCVNPILSLADREVYGIPMLLLIGWRGEPGVKDEPQHIKQGRIQDKLLEAMEIPYSILDANSEDADSLVKRMLALATELSNPVAIIVKSGTFAKYNPREKTVFSHPGINRERAIEIIMEETDSAILVSTTGKTSRELYELRTRSGKAGLDFMCVGSMGHASSIALAVALEKRDKQVVCLDGDGALLMHLGAMALIGNSHPENFIHILLNNKCHESVGEQPTPLERVNFMKLAEALGYSKYHSCSTEEELSRVIRMTLQKPGPIFVDISVRPGSRTDLGRPDSTPEENRKLFMKHLRKS